MESTYPVLDVLDELKQKLNAHPLVILQAPPGAGKSTVLPLALMDEAWLENKKIVMLEPRRLAAKSVAERMASVIKNPIGNKVGYRVRFDAKVSSQTRIEVVTEGILTRMLQHDTSLEDVGLLIFDEFHERSLHADLALALSLQMQQVLRSDLRIMIMSATLDAVHLAQRLGNAPVITSAGRQFPVTIRYAAHESDQPIVTRIVTVIKKALHEEQGDILVFLPGSGEIKRTDDSLREAQVNAVVYPLFGDLPFSKQQEAILPRADGARKIVLATSIAETSLTIEGIRIVIDSGLSRVPRFDPRSGLTRLETIRVAKDSADQRSGRAGRLASGVCIRMWTSGMHLSIAEKRKPEILEADLAPLMLELAEWGVKDINELTWITTPPAGAVSQATELLQQLAATQHGIITPRGRAMLKLPTHPRIAHLLLEAEKISGDNNYTLALACDVAALLEERDPLAKEAGADMALRIEALRKWRAGDHYFADRNTLQRIEKLAAHWRTNFKVAENNSIPHDERIGILAMAAYPERVAQQQGTYSERYKLANGRIVNLPAHDPLVSEPLLAVTHLDASAGQGKIFLAAALNYKDVIGYTKPIASVRWDEDRGGIVGVTENRMGALVLDTKPLTKIEDTTRIAVVLNYVKEKGLSVLGDNEIRKQMQCRMASLKIWRPDESWPDMGDEYLLASLSEWLTPFLHNVSRKSDLDKLDIQAILFSMLPWTLQQRIDLLAPEKIKVPSGSLITVQYFNDGSAPKMEVRLQEVFGLLDTPTVNDGKVKVLLHLLSPGYKPVQVTQDIKSFWQTTYHQVRKELRVRYQKHHWPEDPWTAEAVRGAKKRVK